MAKPCVTASARDGANKLSSSFIPFNIKAGGCKRRGITVALQLHDLPHDTLGDILSRLSLKEATRMNILSSRWRQLCRLCNGNLVFTRETMFSPASTGQKVEDFIRNVNAVLRQLISTTPRNKFVLEFKLLEPQVWPSIDQWVAFCAASGAKHIAFDFNQGSWGGDCANWYRFQLHHFTNGSTVRSLRLMSACLELPHVFCGFRNLSELNLDSVSGDIQGLLLPACPVLEWLRIVRCAISSLSTSQPLCKLRYLCVESCKEMHKIELQAPNLTTFKFRTCFQLVSIMIDGCLEIKEVTVELQQVIDVFDYVFAELPGGFSHVRKLSMEIPIVSKVLVFAKCPSRFVNLRQLILAIHVHIRPESTSGILRFAYLLELAPVLENLELHMKCRSFIADIIVQLEELPPPCLPHNHLKKVHMTGVYGFRGILSLALHFCRNAIALEHMVIDPMVSSSFFPVCRQMEGNAVHWGRVLAKKHLEGQGMDHILTIL